MNTKTKEQLGFIRSYIIYLSNPLKRLRLRTFYAKFLNPGDLCFDIGAHLGIQSIIWRQMGMKVIAVEPNPRLFRFLQKKFQRRPSVKILPNAISDKQETATMHISRIAPTVSTLADSSWRNKLNNASSFEVEWDQTIDVQTITLDQMIEVHGTPKFIKLDIEDFEYQALKGLTSPIPYISFEFFSYSPDRVIQCIQEIDKNGTYSYNYSHGETFRLQEKNWMNSEQALDWIKKRRKFEPHGDIYARLSPEK